MWELVLYTLAGFFGAGLGFFAWQIMVFRRLLGVMSYTTFMSPCEIAAAYHTRYRPLMRALSLDADTLEHVLPKLEERRVVVGREPVPARCGCPREYCLNVNLRRRRREEQKEEEKFTPYGLPA